MKIKRYNLGFGWFGPLEQSDDGKLMRADEVGHIIHQKDQEIGYWEDAYMEEYIHKTKLRTWLQIAATTAIIEAVLLVFVVWG